jgi:aconitate hydratase
MATPSNPPSANPFKAKTTLDTPLGEKTIFALSALANLGPIDRLPYSIRVLLEACLRHCDGHVVLQKDVEAIVKYDAKNVGEVEIPFMPGRVVLQDFTGVPAVVDLAAMRAAMVRIGGSPQKVNPLVNCDLVIDHSIQVDAFGSAQAITINNQLDFERNTERYQFLKWGQQAFNNFSVVPPSTGIVHQVNLEYLAKTVWERDGVLFPDSLVGTDSHTTMINGLGVVGWGVGGIEAEAVMLGQPIYMLLPETIGFKLSGKLREGCTATDLVLTITQILREYGVVEKFVEFFGPGLNDMPVANRATIANMAPEYGATIGFFPIDDQTLKYLRNTGRDEKLVQTVELYAKTQGFWHAPDETKNYTAVLELDLATVEPSLAGPRRPQDRVPMAAMQSTWKKELTTGYGKGTTSAEKKEISEGGGVAVADDNDPGFEGVPVTYDNKSFKLKHGAVAIAAITSCTNTSNPSVMLAAGLVAKKAVEKGLKQKPWVKTSLAPGSKVVVDYYEKAGVMKALDTLGFNVVGFGCTTCIGNSGPLPEPISEAINANDLVVTAVLSGNRNFEGRISPDIKANYLASPPLVVAYALAGTVDINFDTDPIGETATGEKVFLKDIWPTQQEVLDAVENNVLKEHFIKEYGDVFKGPADWQAIHTSLGATFQWDENSTYVQEPPFFVDMPKDAPSIDPIKSARVLAYLGDSVTTDHISPAGSIKKDSPAGKFLISKGVPVSMFNSYGARRGDYRVMTRGTFANIRVKNKLTPGIEGGVTKDFLDGTTKSIYDASVNYKTRHTPLIVIAGKDYGMGSSRDWAAKGTFLLGVKAVIAISFERIHRSNLVGMGVVPLTFKKGENAQTLGLTGEEIFDIDVPAEITPRQDIVVKATKADGTVATFHTTARIDTPVEVDYYRNGGILHTVLRRMAGGMEAATASATQ